jgi:hypothetical protein
MTSRIAIAVVLVGAFAAPAAAQPADKPEVRWDATLQTPRNDDGKHIEVSWTRRVAADVKSDADRERIEAAIAGTGVVVFRRPLAAGEMVADAQKIYVGKPETPELSPAFLYGKDVPGTPPDLAAVRALPWYRALADWLVHRAFQPVDVRDVALEPGTSLGRWTYVATSPTGADGALGEPDEVSPDGRYQYALAPVQIAGDKIVAFSGQGMVTRPFSPRASMFHSDRWIYLAFVLLAAISLLVYMQIAKRRAKDLFIRRIPGVDAIEDAVGRSTEMGRPVLYVTGIEEVTDIQTIASLLILGHVAEMTAEYDTDLKVANTYPMTMVIAEEIVRNGYANAGRLDAHRPENVMFITSEQFAFAAAVTGMILRDRPATNIYLGRFFAESLILAETGYLTGAVQIAGTCEFTQLPFFVAACDYTLIGEELYATSAYLSRDPDQIAQIKAADVVKVVAAAVLIVGVAFATLRPFDEASCNLGDLPQQRLAAVRQASGDLTGESDLDKAAKVIATARASEPVAKLSGEIATRRAKCAKQRTYNGWVQTLGTPAFEELFR